MDNIGLSEINNNELVMSYPSKVWLGFDFDQAEMYFLCLFSKDIELKRALYSKDFHKYVASMLDDIPMEDISPEQREMAKTLSYQLIYSGFNTGIAKGNILKKRRDLNEEKVSEALEKYQEVFFCLFNWVKQAAVDWFQDQGYMTYFMNAKKFINVPAYLPCEPDKLLNSHQGRLCINVYGQNSVGLLLKYVMSNMFRDDMVRNNISQIIPVFDAIYMLVNTKVLSQVINKINRFTTPIIKHNDFEIRMRVSWKLSVKSWGEMIKIEAPNSNDNGAIIYEW